MRLLWIEPAAICARCPRNSEEQTPQLCACLRIPAAAIDCEFCKCKQCDFCRAEAGGTSKAVLPWEAPKAEVTKAAPANTCDSGIVGDTNVAACEKFCSRLGGSAREDGGV